MAVRSQRLCQWSIKDSVAILTDYSASNIITKEHFWYSLHAIFIRGIIKLFTVQEHT